MSKEAIIELKNRKYVSELDEVYSLDAVQIKAIETVLSELDRLQKENTFLKSKIEGVKDFCVIGMQSLENKAKESE